MNYLSRIKPAIKYCIVAKYYNDLNTALTMYSYHYASLLKRIQNPAKQRRYHFVKINTVLLPLTIFEKISYNFERAINFSQPKIVDLYDNVISK